MSQRKIEPLFAARLLDPSGLERAGGVSRNGSDDRSRLSNGDVHAAGNRRDEGFRLFANRKSDAFRDGASARRSRGRYVRFGLCFGHGRGRRRDVAALLWRPYHRNPRHLWRHTSALYDRSLALRHRSDVRRYERRSQNLGGGEAEHAAALARDAEQSAAATVRSRGARAPAAGRRPDRGRQYVCLALFAAAACVGGRYGRSFDDEIHRRAQRRYRRCGRHERSRDRRASRVPSELRGRRARPVGCLSHHARGEDARLAHARALEKRAGHCGVSGRTP